MEENFERRILKNIDIVKEGVIINIIVYTESDEDKLVLEDNEIIFYTREPSIQGRDNAALKRFLSTIGFPITKINIVYGIRSKRKKVLIKDLTYEEVVNKLIKYLTREKRRGG